MRNHYLLLALLAILGLTEAKAQTSIEGRRWGVELNIGKLTYDDESPTGPRVGERYHGHHGLFTQGVYLGLRMDFPTRGLNGKERIGLLELLYDWIWTKKNY